MTDLRANLFYKVKFNIEVEDAQTDLLWRVIWHIKDWQTHKWNRQGNDVLTTDNPAWTRLKTGGRLFSADMKTVYICSEACWQTERPEEISWACKIVESRPAVPGFAPRQWTTEIGFEPAGTGQAVFSCVISYSDRPGFIGMCEPVPEPSVPRLVRSLLGDRKITCRCGADLLLMEPTKLEPADWQPFWERMQSRERIMPYIYISPTVRENGEVSLPVSPEKLVLAAGGNALVFYAEDTGIEEAISAVCPDGFGCYNGTVRIYAPGLEPEDAANALTHRYLTAAYIRDVGESEIVQIVRRALAQDVDFYEKFFRIEDCRERKATILRKNRLAELKKRHSQELQRVESTNMELAVEEERKRLEAEEDRDLLKLEMGDIRDENYRLSREVEAYRPMARRVAELERSAGFRMESREYPGSAPSIISWFERLFSDRLLFAEAAKKDAEDCIIPCDELWKVFFEMATTMWELKYQAGGDIYTEFRERTGINAKRGEGMMTRKDSGLMKQFTTRVGDEDINIEAHITYGKLEQSIHFGFSEQQEKVVIGSCGAHKKIYSTQKHK